MPWPDPKEFASKHNKKLHGHSATVGAAAATAALKEGKDEGSAVRIGNAAGDKAMKKKSYHRMYNKD